MQCPSCGTANPDGARFCNECGARLAIKCPQCGAVQPAGAKFCNECGARLVPVPAPTSAPAQAASSLMATPSPTKAPAATAPIEAQTALPDVSLRRLVPKEFAERLIATRGQVAPERRIVTILFCDVKGSTALGERLDPEELLEVINGAFECLIAPVYQHEGTLARLMGDAILAFFGAPIAHEDDPERAIRAALDIRAGIRRYAERLQDERGIAGFDVRAGINTGLVVVGEVGSDLRVEYTAIGDAINLAARLEQNAPAGGILISHDTYRRVRGVFDVQPQTPLEVKGKSQPVQSYLVLKAKPRARRKLAYGIEGIQIRFVGRAAELLALQQAYEEAMEDHVTRVVTVVGEAGVGKSRLLDEFSDWLDLRPETITYLEGRAVPAGRQIPYAVVRDTFAQRFGILESDTAAEVLAKFRAGMAGVLEPAKADIVGQLAGFELRNVSPHVSALAGSDSFGQLGRAYFTNYISALAAAKPTVLVFEELHWTDDASLDLLANLVAEVPDVPLLIIGSTRPEFFEPGRRPNWGEGRPEAWSRIDLRPLSKRASRELVADILQRVRDLPDRLRDLIVDSAEGNPFYAEELVQMLIDEDVITTVGAAGDETWHVDLARLGGVKVPPALTGILQARLDGLPADERAVLQRAAVVGRMFWDSAVTELMADKADLARVNGLLADARARELVFRREQSAFSGCAEYSFKHAILRDVTYETVLLKLRRKYHAQVAAWLETQAADRQAEYLGVIAGHYELAGEGYKAAQYLHRWGAENMAISAYASAEDAFERGLGVLPLTTSDSREAPDASLTSLRLALLIGLGQAKARMGDLAPATEQLKLAVGLARERAMSHAEAEALVYLGIIAREQGRYREAVENLQPALVLAEASGDRTIEALARRELSVVAYHRGEYDRATAWAEEARSLYEELGHRSGLAGTLNLLGVIEQMQTGHLDQATEYYEQALRLAKETGDRRMLVSVLNNLGDTDHTRGLYDAARARFEECRTILEEIGERPTMAIVLFNLADLHANLGQDDLAQGYIRESIDYGQAAGMTAWCLYDLIIQARLDRRAGRFVRAAELLGLVRNHPSGDQQAFDMLAPDLDALRQDLSEADLEAAVVRGASLDLGQVLQSLRSGP